MIPTYSLPFAPRKTGNVFVWQSSVSSITDILFRRKKMHTLFFEFLFDMGFGCSYRMQVDIASEQPHTSIIRSSAITVHSDNVLLKRPTTAIMDIVTTFPIKYV